MILKQQMKKLIFFTLLGCVSQQELFPASATIQYAWDTANFLRDKVGDVGQYIAGYTLYETIKKVGVRGTMNMLTSKPIAPLALVYLVSSAVNYNADRYLRSRGESAERVTYDAWKKCDWQDRTAFVSKVLTGWLWAYSIMNFLAVTQPLSVSASSKMFA